MGDEQLDYTRPPDEGSMPAGCIMGCLAQVAVIFIVITVGTSSWGGGATTQPVALAVVCAFAQWAIIGPLIYWRRRAGKVATVTGLVIIGCTGTLISSACAAMLVSH